MPASELDPSQLRTLFLKALELPVDQRAAYLDGADVTVEIRDRFLLRKDAEPMLTRSLLGDATLEFSPGTKWNYSPATAVLGDIVEKLSRQSIEEWDQEKIFRPLGMVDTTYTPAPEKAARLAKQVEGKLLVVCATAPVGLHDYRAMEILKDAAYALEA